jgi:predicted short-subunit dehydrogenase-like oxidoreductase (DUF2520 family)
VLIGAGKVASALGPALSNAGIKWLQVYSRDPEKSAVLARKINAEPLTSLNKVNSDVDFILVAVSDDAISSVSDQLPSGPAVFHTSGSRTIKDLGKHSARGVFYPLQTFTYDSTPVFTEIPFCIEGSNENVTRTMEVLIDSLGAKSYRLDSSQRSTLHLAAVIANNFTNHLWGWSRKLLKESGTNPEILHPLMKETLRKALADDPFLVQTGPAARGDIKTIQSHIAMLEGLPDIQNIYRQITTSIANSEDGKL